MAKKIGCKKENSVGQACTTHLAYKIHNKIMKKERQKVKDALKCRNCKHMDQGYCNFHNGWCTLIDRKICQDKDYAYGVIPGLKK